MTTQHTVSADGTEIAYEVHGRRWSTRDVAVTP